MSARRENPQDTSKENQNESRKDVEIKGNPERRVEKEKRSIKVYVLWFLLVLYVCLDIILLVLQEILEADIEHSSGRKRSLHAKLSLASIFFISIGIVIYRVFEGFESRKVKYFHAFLVSIGLVLLVGGVLFAILANKERYEVVILQDKEKQAEVNTEEKPESGKPIIVHMNNLTHYVLGYSVLFIIATHYTLGFFVFMCIGYGKPIRRYYAPFHDMLGTFIYLGLAASYLTGLFYMYDAEVGCCEPASDTARDILHYLTIPVYVKFLIIFGIVISPYYEWDLTSNI